VSPSGGSTSKNFRIPQVRSSEPTSQQNKEPRNSEHIDSAKKWTLAEKILTAVTAALTLASTVFGVLLKQSKDEVERSKDRNTQQQNVIVNLKIQRDQLGTQAQSLQEQIAALQKQAQRARSLGQVPQTQTNRSSPPPSLPPSNGRRQNFIIGAWVEIPATNFVDFDGPQLAVASTSSDDTDFSVGLDQWYPMNEAAISLLKTAPDCKAQLLGDTALNFADAGFDRYDTKPITVCIRSRSGRIAQVTVRFACKGRYSPFETSFKII
jgi:cell division protein FtsB